MGHAQFVHLLARSESGTSVSDEPEPARRNPAVALAGGTPGRFIARI
jgi:hypothetical protein